MDNFLSDELLEQLATLSKLDLADSDKQELRRDLTELLAYVDKLGELDTADTLPLTHFPECTCPLDPEPAEASALPHTDSGLRADVPCPQAQSESFTALAPNRKNGYYIVPNTFHNG